MVDDEVRLVQLQILNEFHRVCENLGLRYSLGYGTLLGAVRHKGYIPWDDDVDVMMPRDDYDELIERAPSLLDKSLFLQSAYSDKLYPLDFAKLLYTGKSLSVVELASLDVVHGVFIDIFPIDRCSNVPIIDFWDRMRIACLRSACYSILDEQFTSSVLRSFLLGVFKGRVLVSGTKPLISKIDSIRRRRNKRKNKFSYFYYSGDNPMTYSPEHKLPYSIIENLTKLEFEGFSYWAVKDYDTLLRSSYGDYMQLPPENERVPMHQQFEV